MDIDQLYSLIKKYRNNGCTSEELQELDQWYELFDEDVDRVSSVPDEKLEYILAQIDHKTTPLKSPKNRLQRTINWVGRVAALVAICLIMARYLMPTMEEIVSKSEIIASIPPGSQQAELIMDDGSTVSLSTTTVVKDKSGNLLKKESSAILDYTTLAGASTENRFNTIAVPMGGEYSVILADGTQVWLNSGSTLRYPVAFGGDKREVTLTGEAYFNVSKSKTPFIVKTSDMDITVLGTSFNISAYANDDKVQTTLVNGSVVVSSKHGNQEYTLKPGHSLSYTKSINAVTVEACDTKLYTSWIDGEFKFRDMRLESILTQLSRWYNCEIIYDDNSLKDICYSGSFERDRPANYLLGLIEMITPVDFEINGGNIIVKKK